MALYFLLLLLLIIRPLDLTRSCVEAWIDWEPFPAVMGAYESRSFVSNTEFFCVMLTH